MMQMMYCMFAFPAGFQNEHVHVSYLHSGGRSFQQVVTNTQNLQEYGLIGIQKEAPCTHISCFSSRRPSFQEGTNTFLGEQQVDTRIQKQTGDVFRFGVFPQLAEPFKKLRVLFLAEKQIVIQKHQRPLNTWSIVRVCTPQEEYLLVYMTKYNDMIG